MVQLVALVYTEQTCANLIDRTYEQMCANLIDVSLISYGKSAANHCLVVSMSEYEKGSF